MRAGGITGAALVVGGLLLVAPRAAAQEPSRDPVAAEALFRAARDDMNAGKLEVACPRFEESYRLDPTPGTLFNVAICYEKAGKLASAWQRWQQAMDAVGESDRRFPEARRHRDDLAARVPRVVVTVAPSFPDDATLSRDGTVFGRASLGVPIPIDPGPHEMVVRLGSAEKKVPFDAVEGETKSLELVAPERGAAPIAPPAGPATSPASAEPELSGSSAQSTLGWIFVAGGGVGLAVFGVTGALVVSADGTASDNCDPRCNADGQSAVDRGGALLVPNAIGLVGGVVLAGVGVTLLLTDPGEVPGVGASLRVGPQGAVATGRF